MLITEEERRKKERRRKEKGRKKKERRKKEEEETNTRNEIVSYIYSKNLGFISFSTPPCPKGSFWQPPREGESPFLGDAIAGG